LETWQTRKGADHQRGYREASRGAEVINRTNYRHRPLASWSATAAAALAEGITRSGIVEQALLDRLRRMSNITGFLVD